MFIGSKPADLALLTGRIYSCLISFFFMMSVEVANRMQNCHSNFKFKEINIFVGFN